MDPERGKKVGNCYHCGQQIPSDAAYGVDILGTYREMCCPACSAVARAIVNGGNERFYDQRTSLSDTAEALSAEDFDIYDSVELRDRFVRDLEDDRQETTVTITNIHCGACLWLIEKSIVKLPGVESVSVNYATRRAHVVWCNHQSSLKSILIAFKGIGYDAFPYEFGNVAPGLQRSKDRQLRRMGISGVLAMQIMMITVALYFGKSSGMATQYKQFFEWVSMLLVLPIVFYCAQPFFVAAWAGIRHGHAVIDLPVVTGISIAFAASIWATITGMGDTYYEAIAMFVFLLLTTRYYEFSVRERGIDAIAHLQHSLPTTANRVLSNGASETVPATRLTPGDVVIVSPGQRVPVDGLVIEGTAKVDESIISGESNPVSRGPGSAIVGGSICIDGVVRSEVTKPFAESTISNIARLAEQAQSEKPHLASVVDRIAVFFVIGLGLVTAAVAWYCWMYAPERLLSTVIAVIVIACPCALSLATPAALSAYLTSLIKRGIVPLTSSGLERLSQVDRVVFDKTGTLTLGELRLRQIDVYGDIDQNAVLEIASALELASSDHPVARALNRETVACPRHAEQLEFTSGSGVQGRVDGELYRLGSRDFATRSLGDDTKKFLSIGRNHAGHVTECFLANDNQLLAVLSFSDKLRSDAGVIVDQLTSMGIQVSILSGDQNRTVKHVAEELGIDDYMGEATPQQKLDRVNHYQNRGERVVAVGDGLNDAPLLSAAATGIAMGSGVDLVRVSGDIVLVNSRLSDLLVLIKQAHRTQKVIKQNFMWAIGYNILALPLGISGLVAPWAAVLGMSLSSAVVVANSIRLAKCPQDELATVAESDTERMAFA